MKRGFLTLELVIAMTLFSLIMSAAVLLAFNGQTAGLDVGMTKEGVLRSLTSLQTDLKASYTAAAYNALASAGTTTEATHYQTSRTVTNGAPCIKDVTDAYGWSSEKNRSLFTGLESSVVSIDIAKALGGGCDPFSPGGEWENPAAYANGFDAGGPNGNAIEAQFMGGKRIAIVVSDHTDNTKHDFYILDTTTTNPPIPVADFDTSRDDNNVYGLNDVALANKTAYVIKNFKENLTGTCQFDVVDQLQVVDLTTLATPVLQPTDTSFDIQGVDPCGTDPDAHVIRYYNGKIFIGLKTTLGPELLIYDVSGSNRLTPVFFGKLYDGFNHSINDIAIEGDYIYVVTDYNSGELFVIDMNDLSTATAYGLPGDLDATKLFLTNDRLYVGRDRATGLQTNPDNNDFDVVDISTPTSPILVPDGYYQLGAGSGTTVTGLSVYGKFAFVGSSDSNTPLFVLDISNPASIASVPGCSLNWSQGTTDIIYIDNLVFVVNRSNDMMRIIYDRPGISCS